MLPVLVNTAVFVTLWIFLVRLAEAYLPDNALNRGIHFIYR